MSEFIYRIASETGRTDSLSSPTFDKVVKKFGHAFFYLTGLSDLHRSYGQIKEGHYLKGSQSLLKSAAKVFTVGGVLYGSFVAWELYQEHIAKKTLTKAFYHQLNQEGPIELNGILEKCFHNLGQSDCHEILKLGNKEWPYVVAKRPDVAARLFYACREGGSDVCDSIKSKALSTWASFAPRADIAEILQSIYCVSEARNQFICSSMMDNLTKNIDEIANKNWYFIAETASLCLKSPFESCANFVSSLFKSDKIALGLSQKPYKDQRYWEFAERACRLPDSILCQDGIQRIFKMWDDFSSKSYWPTFEFNLDRCKTRDLRDGVKGGVYTEFPEICSQMLNYVNSKPSVKL